MYFSMLSKALRHKNAHSDEKSIVDNHCYHIITKFALGIKENQKQLPTLYWLPKLHLRPY